VDAKASKTEVGDDVMLGAVDGGGVTTRVDGAFPVSVSVLLTVSITITPTHPPTIMRTKMISDHRFRLLLLLLVVVLRGDDSCASSAALR
jgi:hypothetical protein